MAEDWRLKAAGSGEVEGNLQIFSCVKDPRGFWDRGDATGSVVLMGLMLEGTRRLEGA